MQWLADIPQEIRLMIHHEVFESLEVIPFEFTILARKVGQPRHAGFALFLANKQVYAECKPIYHKKAIFLFKHPVSFPFPLSEST